MILLFWIYVILFNNNKPNKKVLSTARVFVCEQTLFNTLQLTPAVEKGSFGEVAVASITWGIKPKSITEYK